MKIHVYLRRVRGFTLVEMLVAVSITILVVALLGRVLTGTSAQWQRSNQQIDAFRDSRAALDAITRDFQNAALNVNPAIFLQNDSDAGQVMRTDPRNQEAYAVTSLSNSGKSNLCTVGYYCVWDDVKKGFALKRLYKDGDATFANLKAGFDAAHNPLLFTDLFTQVSPPTATAGEDDVAAYVWNLQFTPGGRTDGFALSYPQTYPPPTAISSTKWKWIEVRFKAMSATAAQKLPGLGVTKDTWFDSTTPLYTKAILPYEEQFVTQIMLTQAQ